MAGVGITIALFLVFELAFPFITLGPLFPLGCLTPGNPACGVLAGIVPMVLKPFAITLLSIALGQFAIRRARTLGLPGWLGLAIPVLVACDWPFLTAFGAGSSYGLLSGTLFVSAPVLALASVMLVVAGGLLPDGAFKQERENRLVRILSLAVGLAIGAIVFARFWAPWGLFLGGTVVDPYPVLLALLAFSLLHLAFTLRHARAPDLPDPEDAADVFLAGLFADVPWRVFGLIALAAASAAFMSARQIGVFGLLLAFGSVVPTAAVYFLALSGAYLLWKRRDRTSGLVAVIAMLPLVHWGYLHVEARLDLDREMAEIRSSVGDGFPSPLPANIVLDAGDGYLHHFPGAQHVYVARGSDRYDRVDIGTSVREEQVVALPSDYLHLRRFSSRNADFVVRDGPPLEMVFVSPSAETILASRSNGVFLAPSWPPILTTRGWMRADVTMRYGSPDPSIERFVLRALSSGFGE